MPAKGKNFSIDDPYCKTSNFACQAGEKEFRVASEDGPCKGEDGHAIRGEPDCKLACSNLVGVDVSEYAVNGWDHSPGCFYYKKNQVCHWNWNHNGQWTHPMVQEVCQRGEKMDFASKEKKNQY